MIFFFFVDIDKLILKFTWEGKEMRIARISLKKKKREVGRIILHCFKTNCKATIFKTIKLQYSIVSVKEQI